MFVELIFFNIPTNLFMNKNTCNYLAPNFMEMINELKGSHGMTHEKIAYLLRISNASTVHGWERGTKPFYEHGEALIELWKNLMDKSDYEIPRINRNLISN